MPKELIPRAKELLDIERESDPGFQPTIPWLQRFLRVGYQTCKDLMADLEEAGLKEPAIEAEQVEAPPTTKERKPVEPIEAEVTPVEPEKPKAKKTSPKKSEPKVEEPKKAPTAGDDDSPVVGAAADDEERQHAEHSPSSLKFKAVCPGFRQDQAGDKKAADRGTLGHKAAELEDTTVCGDDEDLASAAQKCIAYVQELRAELEKNAVKGISRLPGGAKLPLNPAPGMVYEYTEIKVFYDGEWGFFDKLFIDCDSKIAHLLDHKFAWNFYEADAPQFWAYIYGILNAVPWLEEVNVHVLHPFRNEIDIESFDLERINDSTAKVLAIVTRARKNDPATYRTGPHCEYCGQRLDCPKINSLAIEVASKFGPELVIPAELSPENITDPAMMAHAKMLAPVLEKWAGQVNAYALAMAREGTVIPGFHLKERNAKFSITNAAIAYSVVEGIVSPEEFASCSTTAIGALEKIYSTNAKEKAKEAGEKTTKRAEVEKLRSLLLDAAAANNEGTVYYLDREKGGAIEDSGAGGEEETLLT